MGDCPCMVRGKTGCHTPKNEMFKEKNHKFRLLAFLAILATLCVFQLESYALDVTLQWSANVEPDLAGYKIYYKPGSSGGKKLNNYPGKGATEGDSPITMLLDKDKNPDPNLVQFTLHNLDADKKYFMAVTAIDTKGFESEASNEVRTDYSGPGKVLILSASPPAATWSDENTVAVTWVAPSGLPDGIDIEGYSVVWDMSSGTTPDAAKTLDAVTSTTGTVLPDGNRYYFHIRPLDTAGNWGEAEHYGPFYIDTGPPRIGSVQMISETTVEITYSENNMQNATVSGNYTFDNEVIVSEVTDVTGEGRTFLLSLLNLQGDMIYTMTISENVTDAAGHPILEDERIIGEVNDFDYDGMADIWEIVSFGDTGLSDGSGDIDGDGIKDQEEVSVYHIDPLNPDTDGDGLADGHEVVLGRDPALKEVVFGLDSEEITNPFLPLSLDLKMKYAGTGTMAGYGHYSLVLGKEVVDSVECLKVVERGHGNSKNPDLDPEWYMRWLAQDTSGVVWLLQEYSGLADSYRFLGRAGAVVWLPAIPVLGQRFAEEGLGYREVIGTGYNVEQLTTGLGSYPGCLTVRWRNGNHDAFVYFAPGVGIVKAEWSGGETTNGWELQELGKARTVPDELVADFGGGYGLWHYDPLRGWTQLNTVNPELMLAADLDSDGREELVASFKGNGLYVYKESRGWSQINGVTPEAMIRLGNGLVANYGVTYGLWHYDPLRGWTQLNTVNPDLMLATDLDSDGIEELVFSFNSFGLYVYKESRGWSQINGVTPEAMIRLGNGLVANYGVTYGLWHYDTVRGWMQLNTENPEQMLAADLDSDGIEELIASFTGYGLCSYNEWNGWSKIYNVVPQGMTRFSHGLVVDYGSASGLWHYDREGGWRQLKTVSPDRMLALDMDKDGVEELVSFFTADGLYIYREANGWVLFDPVVPVAAIGINLLN